MGGKVCLRCKGKTLLILEVKVETILKGTLDSISSPSVKIQIMGEVD